MHTGKDMVAVCEEEAAEALISAANADPAVQSSFPEKISSVVEFPSWRGPSQLYTSWRMVWDDADEEEDGGGSSSLWRSC